MASNRNDELVRWLLSLAEIDIELIIKDVSKQLSTTSIKSLDKYFSRESVKRKKSHKEEEDRPKHEKGSCSGNVGSSVNAIANIGPIINTNNISDPFSRSAWKSPLIFRGDKVPENGKLFLDVEKVNLKISHKLVAATIAIVNEAKTLVLWAYISWPHREVCQYFTQFTNLKRGSLDIGVPVETIHVLLDKCLEGNLLIGQDIKQDLISLQYNHRHIEDLQDFFKDRKRQAYSLKALAQAYLDKDQVQEGAHSAIIDARLTRDLYFVKERLIIENDNSDIDINIPRPYKAPYIFDPRDRCHCINKKRRN